MSETKETYQVVNEVEVYKDGVQLFYFGEFDCADGAEAAATELNLVQTKLDKANAEIERLKERVQILTSCLSDNLDNISCDHRDASECTPCNIDAVLARYSDHDNISLVMKLKTLKQFAKQAIKVIGFYGDMDNWFYDKITPRVCDSSVNSQGKAGEKAREFENSEIYKQVKGVCDE